MIRLLGTLINGGLEALKGALSKGLQVYYSVSRDCVRCLGRDGACEKIDMTENPLSCYDCLNGSNFPECSASHDKSISRVPSHLSCSISHISMSSIP